MRICKCGGYIGTSELSGDRKLWRCRDCGRSEITGESVHSMHRSSEGLRQYEESVATPPDDRVDASTPPFI